MSQGTPEPVRWRDAGEWQELAQDLDLRAGAGPSAEQQARLLARLEELDDVTSAGAPARSGAGKLTLVGVALLVGAASLYLAWSAPWTRHSEATHALPTNASTPSAFPASEAPAPVAAAPAEHAPAAPSPERSKPARDTRARTPRTAVTAPEPSGTADPVAELVLLTRARRVLLTDPARSLALAEEHTQTYPRGVFAEEREVLAVEALIRAGQLQEGKQRGERFLRTHPNSAHGVRMRELLRPFAASEPP